SADSRIENVQASNAGTGIRLYGSPNTSISGCTTSGNDYHGIWADSLSGATLTGNTTRQNRYYGIYLRAVSASTVTTNTIEANAVGLYLEGAQNNQLYANRLTANTTQASVMNGSGNVFSLPAPVGGNYWSNWATPDVNHDGFVDQPYVFFGGRDDLPLAEVGWSDTTAPVTRITLSGTLGQNGWYRSEVGITLTAEDEPDGSGLDVVQYSFDGEVWNRYTGPFAVCSEGSTVLYYRAIDKAGNVEEENGSPKSASFKMDKTPPTITSQRNPGPNTAGWNNSNVTVSFTAEDALSGLASVTPTVIVSREAAGQAVTGIAVDRAGNQATLTVSDISIDKTPPVLIGAPLAAPNAFGWFNGDVTVHWTASDNLSGFDPADVPPDTVLTLEGVGLSVGPVTLTDRAGNAVTASVTGINIDKTPPTLSFGACSPAANAAGWHRSAVSIPFEASDALSGLDPANPASPVLLEEEGMAVSRTVTIADRAGNRISLDTPALRIDWTPPDLAVWATTPAGDYAAGSWTNQDVTVHFGAIDGLSGLLSVPSDTLVTSEGSGQTVVGVAVDQAGNSTTASFSPINIDKTPPRLSAERSPDPNAAGWNNTDVTITFTAADDLSGLASVPAPATVTQEGANMAVVGTATDLAGNSSSLLVEGINIDKTPPRLVASRSPEANMLGWNNTDVTVTFAAGDDLSGLASTTAPVTLPNEGLGQTVTGVATDWAGNETTVTIGDINIDKTPPAVTGAPLTAPNEAGWYAGDVVVRWQVSDALAGVEPAAVPVDTVVTGEGAALSAGPVSVLDRAGNVGTGLTEGIAIDRTPPAIAIAVPQPGQVLPSGTALQFATVDGLSGVGSSVGYLSNRKTTIEVTSGYRPAQGAYDLTVVAVDRAGNRATESRSFSVLPPQTTRIVGTGWFEIGSGQRGRPLANKVAFSFTCHYRQGDPAPTSRWPFMLLADNLRFRSTQYTWLAVDDHAAHFGGRGIVNGSGEYGFLVSVEEGTRGDQDRIRVKIWRLADGTVVLDSQPGADDLAAPATPLRGGRIDIRG
ncbi:MAG: right-handed parallel beta-helix repeat-containing protein, partial [Anaerolineae bacterium]